MNALRIDLLHPQHEVKSHTRRGTVYSVVNREGEGLFVTGSKWS